MGIVVENFLALINVRAKFKKRKCGDLLFCSY